MDLFYQPSSIRMEHAGLLSSTDAAIYSFKNFAIHQLVQHQPGFRVQYLLLKNIAAKTIKTRRKFVQKQIRPNKTPAKEAFIFVFVF